mmetsp:Transcript_21139/g.54517  ORF Transcript_21139/g.54517 Transcript_21139/m.54517 type:complete len:110 (+) Transcript_21139:347-676(+)
MREQQRRSEYAELQRSLCGAGAGAGSSLSAAQAAGSLRGSPQAAANGGAVGLCGGMQATRQLSAGSPGDGFVQAAGARADGAGVHRTPPGRALQPTGAQHMGTPSSGMR